MKNRVKDILTFKKQGRKAVLLFFSSFILILTACFITLATKFFTFISLFFILISVLCFILACLVIKNNFKFIDQFSDNSYHNSHFVDHSRLKLFHRLIDENLFEYHFQPIISARNGDIFAYEALMRSSSQIGLSPLEILDYATKENRLYDIEKYTFTNTLKLLKENPEVFKSKKLFINSVSSHLLNDSDYNELYKEYTSYFENIVLEITEGTLLSDSGIASIQKRIQESNCQLALDDYGTGYSNESNLLKTNPNYIKIDRTILSQIDINPKKQHLVSNLVNFASNNNIKTIAEGIETYEEFKYVINIGVDYIQGYYTAKPNPVLLKTLPNDCIDTIFELNKKRLLVNLSKRVYETKGELLLSLSSVMKENYTDIIINQQEIIVTETADLPLCIHIPDNLNCSITLDNVNIKGNDSTTITIGNNCSVKLSLIGVNIISNDGIRVPESSTLLIQGPGNLTINIERTKATGIGGNHEQSYGDITIDIGGILSIKNIVENSIGIGGAYNKANSTIHFASGTVNIETSGSHNVATGCINGNAIIKVTAAILNINAAGTTTVGIGSMEGPVQIESTGELNLFINGWQGIGIGTLDHGSGTILIQGGSVTEELHVHSGAGIGSIGGDISTTIYQAAISLHAEGTEVAGIGDFNGSGTVKILGGIIGIILHSSHPLPIGNKNKIAVIEGGNIQCTFRSKWHPINSVGTPLIERTIHSKDPFSYEIHEQDYSYIYQAEYSTNYPDIKVFLPEE